MALLEIGILGYTIKQLIDGTEYNEKANNLNLQSFEKISITQKKIKVQYELTESSLKKLTNRKKGIYLTSLNSFVEIYENIIKFNLMFSENSISNEESLISDIDLRDIKDMVDISGRELTSKESFVKYIISGYGGMKLHQSKVNFTIAEMRVEQSNVVEKQGENICITLYGIQQRADKFSKILATLNLFLMKSIKTTQEIINKKGNDRNSYTNEDKEKLKICMNIAKTLKDFIVEPIFDYNGDFAKESIEAIRKGEEYLKKINLQMNR